MSIKSRYRTNQHRAQLDAATQAVRTAGATIRQDMEVIASPGRKFPTLARTRLGLDVTINNQGQGYAASLQEARLLAFLQQDDQTFAPMPDVRATNRYAVQNGWHEVDSTSIAAVKWDADRQSLTVEFLSNRSRYRYDQVPERVVHELLHAPSIGSFFETRIKRHYASTKLPE